MEIEAKVNLATEADYLKCVEIFAKDGGEQTVLENYFFDGHAGELAAQGVMLRLRVKGSATAELTLKTHTEVERGSACRFLDSSTTIPIAVAQAAITDSSALMQVAEVPQALAKYGVSTLKYLGGFRTTRKVCFVWTTRDPPPPSTPHPHPTRTIARSLARLASAPRISR